MNAIVVADIVNKMLPCFVPFEKHIAQEDIAEYLLNYIECRVIAMIEKIDVSSESLFAAALTERIVPLWNEVYSFYKYKLSEMDRILGWSVVMMNKAHAFLLDGDALISYEEFREMVQLEIDIAPLKMAPYQEPEVAYRCLTGGHTPLPFDASFIDYDVLLRS